MLWNYKVINQIHIISQNVPDEISLLMKWEFCSYYLFDTDNTSVDQQEEKMLRYCKSANWYYLNIKIEKLKKSAAPLRQLGGAVWRIREWRHLKTAFHLPQTIPELISPNLWLCALQMPQQLGRAKKNIETTFLDSIPRCYWCSMKYIDQEKQPNLKAF